MHANFYLMILLMASVLGRVLLWMLGYLILRLDMRWPRDSKALANSD